MGVSEVVTLVQLAALRHVVAALERAEVPYQVTGGLAGNVHGSRWPLRDLDLDVHTADLPLVAHLFASGLTWGPGRYRDAEFDLALVRLAIGGVPVDISGAEGGFAARGPLRQPLIADLSRAEQHTFLGMLLRVQPLKDLIAYKTLLERTVDLADLSMLRGDAGAP